MEHPVLHAEGCQVILGMHQVLDVEVRAFGSCLLGVIWSSYAGVAPSLWARDGL